MEAWWGRFVLQAEAPNGSVLLNWFCWATFNTNQHYSVKRARKCAHTYSNTHLQAKFCSQFAVGYTNIQNLFVVHSVHTLIPNIPSKNIHTTLCAHYFVHSFIRYVNRLWIDLTGKVFLVHWLHHRSKSSSKCFILRKEITGRVSFLVWSGNKVHQTAFGSVHSPVNSESVHGTSDMHYRVLESLML